MRYDTGVDTSGLGSCYYLAGPSRGHLAEAKGSSTEERTDMTMLTQGNHKLNGALVAHSRKTNQLRLRGSYIAMTLLSPWISNEECPFNPMTMRKRS
jgi:hypothetical protein